MKATAVAELRLTGRPASPGLALSRLFVLADAERGGRVASPATSRREAERAACGHRRRDRRSSRRSARQADEDAREILEFQIAMLGDEALAEAGLRGDRRRRRRRTAPGAAALDAQIADYAERRGRVFPRPRADLADLRDRVLRMPVGRDGSRALPAGTVLVARDLPPSRFLGIDWTRRRRPSRSPAAARPATSRCWRARAAFRWWSASAPT